MSPSRKQQVNIPKNVRVITKKDEESINRYFKDISNIPLITQEREVELAIEIKKGNQKALDELVTSNLRFVISVAKQYQNYGVGLSDLISEGNIGLIKAAKAFDETKGYRFITYAIWWIRQSIVYALAEHSRIVHIPMNRYTMSSKVKKFMDNNQDAENKVTHEEIAEELGIDIEQVLEALQTPNGVGVSLSTPIGNDEDKGSELIDTIANTNVPAPDHDLDLYSLHQAIEEKLQSLSERERVVIKMFFGIDFPKSMTLQEISDSLGLTKECIRQTKEKAIRRLKLMDNSKLRAYLG